MTNTLEIRRVKGKNCCNSITLQSIPINNLQSVIDKRQTGVMSTTYYYYSPTYAISDWTLCAQAFCHHVFLLGWSIYIQLVILRVFWCGNCKFFSSVNKNDADITGWIFFSNSFKWQSLAWKFTSLIFGSFCFLSTNISRSSVTMCLRWVGYLIIAFPEIYC